METNLENTALKESPMKEIAREFKRMNDIREVEMLCRLVDAARGAAKTSFGERQIELYEMGRQAAMKACVKADEITRFRGP